MNIRIVVAIIQEINPMYIRFKLPDTTYIFKAIRTSNIDISDVYIGETYMMSLRFRKSTKLKKEAFFIEEIKKV